MQTYKDYVGLPPISILIQLVYLSHRFCLYRGCTLKQVLRGQSSVWQVPSVPPYNNSPPHFDKNNLILTDTRPHSLADLHTLRSHVEQRFQELELHWYLSEYAGHFRCSQIQGDFRLSLLSSPGVKVCFPRLHGTVSLVKICLGGKKIKEKGKTKQNKDQTSTKKFWVIKLKITEDLL